MLDEAMENAVASSAAQYGTNASQIRNQLNEARDAAAAAVAVAGTILDEESKIENDDFEQVR